MSGLDALAADLAARLGPHGTVEVDAPFGVRTTYRVGGNAAIAVDVDATGLGRLAGAIDPSVAVVVLGNGSNLLVGDAGFAGVVVSVRQLDVVQITDTTVVAGGGADLPRVARACVEAGLEGFTWAVGVPGTVGGAVAMNAGGHGADLAASLVEVDLVDLVGDRTGTVARSDLDLGYRRSNLAASTVVRAATLSLAVGDRATESERLREIVAWRRANQPGGRNCGSVFVNPPGDAAGRLIAAAGLQGFCVGGASVSTKHANFIQATDGATAADVAAVIRAVRDAVEAQTGIRLETELRIVGDVEVAP